MDCVGKARELLQLTGSTEVFVDEIFPLCEALIKAAELLYDYRVSDIDLDFNPEIIEWLDEHTDFKITRGFK